MRQAGLFEEITPKEKLPTNLTSNRYAVHRWSNFIAGFSPEFVSLCIRDAGLGPDERLIDPFAGLSTSLVQANFEGVPSVGFEPHPFFYDISICKLFPPSHPQQVDAIQEVGKCPPYHGSLLAIWTPCALEFLAKLVPEADLRCLASALLREIEIEPEQKPLYRLVISRVLELCAWSQTDGIYKAPTTRKNSIPYSSALRKVCGEIREDVSSIDNRVKRLATLYRSSSEVMAPIENASCSLCVTSPPYLNNFDFAEMTRMELYFWRYASSWGEITQYVRRHLIVNTTTAPTDLKRDQERFSKDISCNVRKLLDPLVSALQKQRRVRAGKKEYDLLVYPYFGQMQHVFRELWRVLRPRSPFHLVVADAALYGIHIQTERLLSELMQECGLDIVGIERLRSRGDRWVLAKRQGANQPLGEFHIHARRA